MSLKRVVAKPSPARTGFAFAGSGRRVSGCIQQATAKLLSDDDDDDDDNDDEAGDLRREHRSWYTYMQKEHSVI